MHGELHDTPGAAAAIAEVNLQRDTFVYAAVGNTSARFYLGGQYKGCVSVPGIIGFRMPKVQEFVHPWNNESILVMYGLTSRIEPADFASHHEAVVAGGLYRDHRRGTDDATIVVAKSRNHQ